MFLNHEIHEGFSVFWWLEVTRYSAAKQVPLGCRVMTLIGKWLAITLLGLEQRNIFSGPFAKRQNELFRGGGYARSC